MSWKIVTSFRLEVGSVTEKESYQPVNSVQYIMMTPCLYSQSLNTLENTLHLNFWNHQLVKQKLSVISCQ